MYNSQNILIKKKEYCEQQNCSNVCQLLNDINISYLFGLSIVLCCKLVLCNAYYSFHNVHIYCQNSQQVTVDYTAFGVMAMLLAIRPSYMCNINIYTKLFIQVLQSVIKCYQYISWLLVRVHTGMGTGPRDVSRDLPSTCLNYLYTVLLITIHYISFCEHTCNRNAPLLCWCILHVLFINGGATESYKCLNIVLFYTITERAVGMFVKLIGNIESFNIILAI
jgi:hypothetical protein